MRDLATGAARKQQTGSRTLSLLLYCATAALLLVPFGIVFLGDGRASYAGDGGGSGPAATAPAGSADNLCKMGHRVGPPQKNAELECANCDPKRNRVTTPPSQPLPQPEPKKNAAAPKPAPVVT